MFDTRAVEHSFGNAADTYDANAQLQQVVRTHCLKLAQKQWKAGAHVLDAGCGTGAFFKEAKSSGWRMHGLDVAEGMCALAEKYGYPVTRADAAATGLADHSFDGIFSSLMLQWANDPSAIFSEMARLLKTNGTIVLSTLVEGTLVELQHAFVAVDNAPHVSVFLKPHALLESAEKSGLALVSATQATLVEHYPDAVAVMRALQAIGATNKHVQRKRGLMTPRQIARLEQAYAQYKSSRGLPASWQVLYLILRKS